MRLRIDQLLYKKEKSLWSRIYLFPLYLLSIPYQWAVKARVFFYDAGLLKTKRLPCPVISVGNITIGGTGKTPLTMLLARGLKERGITIAILSRGYRRKQSSDSLVSDGQSISLSPEEAGDEPYLMATSLKDIPVLVNKDRFVTGQMALQRFGVRGLLLDDGYQHLQLHRNLNILLIDLNVGFGDDHLLPRGILREPLSHLQRADLFVLTKVEDPKACQRLEMKLHQIHPQVEVFHSHYESLSLINPKGEEEDLPSFHGKKVLALSGIANPDYFSFLLKKCGMEIGKEIIFPDHHFYTTEDLAYIEKNISGMNWLVTTEKDMLKLQTLGVGHLPIRALRIEMKIWEEEEFFEKIMQLFLKTEERKN
jgi:tetraacyldisaccharide 4'-kinase